ncbi:MAG: tetratricopeptide (TPR) repeat protein [Gammaproteobacteria bacterium]|jgi:tetratricopeptide (TPR) repeat protein
MKPLLLKNLGIIFLLLGAMPIQAAQLPETTQPVNAEYTELAEDVLALQTQWAKVNYQLKGDQQESAFKALLSHSGALTQVYPNDAEIWIWHGIVQSSYAGAKGGLGALSLAKASKASLEKALELDDKALDGSAHTSLGILYHKVPGWPLSFGSDKKAQQYLQNAIAINPSGIDPNYFYGEFLYDNREYAEAKKYLELAMQAPPRHDRPLADKSRQQEVTKALAQVNSQILAQLSKKERN